MLPPFFTILCPAEIEAGVALGHSMNTEAQQLAICVPLSITAA
jgi:hypothetical protein